MNRTTTRRAALVALVVPLALGLAVSPAHADEEPRGGKEPHQEHLDVGVDPFAGDSLITEAQESGELTIAPGVTCRWQNVISTPATAPNSPAFSLVYMHPYDVTPADHLDRPRGCSDGKTIPSSVAKSSRNLATFQHVQDAGLHYRTLNLAYQHFYTGDQYATRGVRRVSSPTSAASWAVLKTWDDSTGTSQKLTRMTNELISKGFDVERTRYAVVLDAGANATCTTSGCSVVAGVAETPGAYGMSLRFWKDPRDGRKHYRRFGCATDGDNVYGHETTHQVGAEHVGDTARDLMSKSGGNNTTYRTGTLWDYNRNNYHSTVQNSVYVVGNSSLAGNWYTC